MHKKPEELYLHEQMLLLILRDKEGTVESKAGMYRLALGGAILTELVLNDRIAIDGDKKKLVTVTSTEPLGEPVLDEALAIMTAKKRRRAPAWVASLAGIKRLRHRIAGELCRRRILKDSEDTVLLIFKRKAYPTINPVPERRLLNAISKAIRGAASRIDPRTTVLIALAHATGTLRAHFDRQTLKQYDERIKKIIQGELVGDATHEAVQAAVMAAVTAATVTTSATTH